MQIPTRVFNPFMKLPIDHNARREISQGWLYSPDELVFHPKITDHNGVDFPGEIGTPVYAVQHGWAVASYHLSYIKLPNRKLVGFAYGLFVSIWHDDPGLYTISAHLSRINERVIPYIPPTQGADESWEPTQAICLPVDRFKRQARRVIQGEWIGNMGATGLLDKGLDSPSKNPPSTIQTRTWDPHGPHLHFEACERMPSGVTKDAKKRYDPFDIYGEREAYAHVFDRACGMFLAGPDGKPLFAR